AAPLAARGCRVLHRAAHLRGLAAARGPGLQRQRDGERAPRGRQRAPDLVARRAARWQGDARVGPRRTLLDGRGQHAPLPRPRPGPPARRDARGPAVPALRPRDEPVGHAVRRARQLHRGARRGVRAGAGADVLRWDRVPLSGGDDAMTHRTRPHARAAATAAAALPLLAGCGRAGPALGPPLTLADAGASNPTVAVDPRTGTAYVAWVGVQSGNADVYLARIERGEAGAPVRVNDIPGDAAPHEQAPAQVAVAPNGDVLVLWQNNTPVEGRRFPASDLRLARSTDGGRTFEPAVTVNDDAGGLPSSHTFHDIAVAPDGTVYVS